MLGWKDGRLVKLWGRLIEHGIERKQTILRPGVDPVQDVDGDGRPEIVVSIFNASGDDKWHVEVLEGACDRIMAIEAARVKWCVSGRGMYPGMWIDGLARGGVVLADLLGNGRLCTIAATSSPLGCARLVAIDPDGKQIWHRDFHRFAGAPPEWNVAGLTFWFAGRFTSRDHCDVLVSFRRSTMHSDESCLLDGRNGRELWRRTASATTVNGCVRGCGGGWMDVFDYDGDGRAQLAVICMDGSVYCVGQGGLHD